MRSLTTPSFVAAAALAVGLSAITTSPSSSSSSYFFAYADEEAQASIIECDTGGIADCAAKSNRTCYNYVEEGTQDCGYCLPGFFEFEDECYSIEEIGTDGFLILARLLEIYLPNYVDPTVTTEERALRLIISASVISEWNSQVPPPSFTLGLTNETFLTETEEQGRLGVDPSIQFEEDGFRGKISRFVSGKRRGRRLHDSRELEDDVPSAIDWEAEGYTTHVKNQLGCGCCWSVSVAAAVESALMITKLTPRYDTDGDNSLSFQQMISCDTKENGCGGGNILQATRFVWEHDHFGNNNLGGLVSYEEWPYTDYRGVTTETCAYEGKTPKEMTPVAFLNFPQLVNSVNDRDSFEKRKERMMWAVSKQPVINVLRSSCPLLMNYREGVLTHDTGCECSSTSCIDHATVIVGYDATASPPYWKVRNSWGPGFGEGGHFRVAMNDPGKGDWGLFGMLAESAMPSQAVTKAEDLPERPGWWETAAGWEKALVIIASIMGFCCLCGCLAGLRNKMKGSDS